MLAYLVGLGMLGSSPRAVVLTQGGLVRPLSAASFRYENAEDATLDSRDPDFNFGGQTTLDGGPGRVILIQFGDLQRALGPNAKILSAKLILTVASGQAVHLLQARQIAESWHEGPILTVSAMIAELKRSAKAGGKSVERQTPNGAVSWRHRVTGEERIPWQQPGVQGPSDAKPIEVLQTFDAAHSSFEIGGLESVVQSFADRWYDNHGLVLEFDSPVEFQSSKASSGRPKLALQVENVASRRGPDLSVVFIAADAAGVAGTTLTAHVKNVGDAIAAPFKAIWIDAGRPGSAFEVASHLAPGQETTVTTTVSRHAATRDHRLAPVGLRIFPAGSDASASNDYLEIVPEAIAIEVEVDDRWFGDAPTFVGTNSFEDWIQAEFRTLNDTFLARSRFSFAPDGAIERVRIGHIVVGTKPEDSGQLHELRFSIGDDRFREPFGFSAQIARSVGGLIGLTDLSPMQFTADRVHLSTGARRSTSDPFAGAMGGGDTRFEGALPPEFCLPLDPSITPELVNGSFEPTNLFSATDVGALNAANRELSSDGSLRDQPRLTLIHATTRSGLPLANLQLTLYQCSGGTISDANPVGSATTSAQGIVAIPNRGSADDPAKRGGPFGILARDGSNGSLLVAATLNGVTDFQWLKAWQLSDAFHRGNPAAAVIDIAFDLPSDPLDETTDLAAHRIVTDSENDAPAKLQPLVDGGSSVDLTPTPGSWIEVDLGRDRPIGEIRIVGGCWSEFDIEIYGTGQKPAQATLWAKERAWAWTVATRGDSTTEGMPSVAYRSHGLTGRFVRIVNRSTGPAKLSKLLVVPIKLGG